MRIIILSIVIMRSGYLARPVVVNPSDENHIKQNRLIEHAVLAKAKTGDGLVTRGYHATDNLVSNASWVPISHMAVCNLESRQAIEAEGKSVHEPRLSDFINKLYRLIIIRPWWRTDPSTEAVWRNAKELLGSDYMTPYLGMSLGKCSFSF